MCTCIQHVYCFRYFGCGVSIPDKLEGAHVLDLGSGSGRDCYVISKLIGPNGFVTGIDMADGQVHVYYYICTFLL